MSQISNYLTTKCPKHNRNEARPLYLHHRVGREMSLENDDEVDIELTDISTRISLKVKLCDDVNFDACYYHSIPNWKYACRSSSRGVYEGDFLSHIDGSAMSRLQRQPFWWGPDMSKKYKGSIKLNFCGAARTVYTGKTAMKSQKGPFGYGFSIANKNDEEFIRGYGYYPLCSGSEYPLLMGYKALSEGLLWAFRMDPDKLSICGPSLVIHLVNQYIELDDPTLNSYHKVIKKKIKSVVRHTRIHLKSIDDKDNIRAMDLANMAIDSKTQATFCNWDKICELHHKKDIFAVP